MVSLIYLSPVPVDCPFLYKIPDTHVRQINHQGQDTPLKSASGYETDLDVLPAMVFFRFKITIYGGRMGAS